MCACVSKCVCVVTLLVYYNFCYSFYFNCTRYSYFYFCIINFLVFLFIVL